MTFSEEQSQLPMTTLIERIQVLESKVNNLEPSLSTLHSYISSGPLEPSEGARREEGQTNDTTSAGQLSHEQTLQKRIETWRLGSDPVLEGFP